MTKKLNTLEDVRHLLLREINAAGSESGFARRVGINRAYVNQVVTGKKYPGAKILAVLNLKKVRPLSRTSVRHLLRKEVQRAGSQSEWARQMGVDRANLNLVINGKLAPTSPIFKALKFPPFLYLRVER
jgi:DNA-binding transcriptional regulator YdaS (Cro superfamily)